MGLWQKLLGRQETDPPCGPRSVRVGSYTLELPASWGTGAVRAQPGISVYNAVAAPGVSFAFNVMVGIAGDTQERTRLVDAMVTAYGAGEHVVTWEMLDGIELERHRMENTRRLGPGSVYEFHLFEAHGDLLQFGYGFVGPLPDEDALRESFKALVRSAVRRTDESSVHA